MGFDTTYMKRWDEEVVLDETKSGRILLTTSRRKKIPYPTAIVIDTDDVHGQLKQVLKELNLRDKIMPLTRCIICNRPLVEVKPEAVKDRVPEYVYLTQSSFAKCPSCSRVYWEGTHSNNILKTINKLLETG